MDEQRIAGAHRRIAGVVAALLITVGLVGCSDNPAPKPIEDDTTAASSTPSRSASASPVAAPTMPPEAKGTSKEAAIAFVEHVIEVLNYTARTLDTRALTAVSVPSCRACRSIRESVADLRSAGGSISGGEWSPLHMRVHMPGGSRLLQVEAVVEAASQTVEPSAGASSIKHPAGKTVYVFDIEPVAAGWQVLEIQGDGS